MQGLNLEEIKKQFPPYEGKPSMKQDIAGQHIGHLDILYRAANDPPPKAQRIQYVCRCDCGKIFVARKDNLLRHPDVVSCGHINSQGKINISAGEQSIINLLNQNKIIFEKDKSFDDCYRPNPLNKIKKCKFDFYIPKFNTCIEYDGEQHFNSNAWWGTTNTFADGHDSDLFKNQYCWDHKITLIRIPYSKLNTLSFNDLNPSTSNYILTPENQESYYIQNNY